MDVIAEMMQGNTVSVFGVFALQFLQGVCLFQYGAEGIFVTGIKSTACVIDLFLSVSVDCLFLSR